MKTPEEFLATASENLYQVFGKKEVIPNNIIEEEVPNIKNEIDKPRQIIYFGAPGTGKSFELNRDSKVFNSKNVKRVTFHRSMTYGQFVGVFKPFPNGDSITYKYIPGYLLRQLFDALLNPENNYLLIIEEINRADVSSVFGDIFQLLDRNNKNVSSYPIALSYDIEQFLSDEDNSKLLNVTTGKFRELGEMLQVGLYLPSNLYIWTTMNSADQGVMQMDTAFKRRWEQKYFGIDDAFVENESTFNSYFPIQNGIGKTIPWNDLRKSINSKLIKLKIPEDKLLGPYYLSENILLSNIETITESFESKVIMYLYDDVLRHNRSSFFDIQDDRMIYSEIVKDFKEKGVDVFKIDISSESI